MPAKWNIFADIATIVVTPRCLICGRKVMATMNHICPRCRLRIPLTNYWRVEENPVKRRFDGMLILEQGSAFLFYRAGTIWQRIIHRFKYEGRWRIAHHLGLWYGAELSESELYADIDVIVPIPLHFIKGLRRTYNQATYIAEGIAKSMGKELDTLSVRRKRNNPSQTKHKGYDRWTNVEDIFEVVHPERLRGKHILVVDDVMTSGATLYSCLKCLSDALPDARLSFAALAVTQYISDIR